MTNETPVEKHKTWSIYTKRESAIFSYIRTQPRWKFALSDEDGSLLAILQDDCLEIRPKRNNYTTIIGTTVVPIDDFPEWRKVAWSMDGLIVVYSNSVGVITAFNPLGTLLFTLPSRSFKLSSLIPNGALVALLFVNPPQEKITSWSHELISIDYNGYLEDYLISGDDAVAYHDSQFKIPPLSTSAFLIRNEILLLASSIYPKPIQMEDYTDGISCWKRNGKSFDLIQPSKTQLSTWNKTGNVGYWIRSLYKEDEFNVILRMEISKDEELILCLHNCGDISIRNIPSLLLMKKWSHICSPSTSLQDLTLPVDIAFPHVNRIAIVHKNGIVTSHDAENMNKISEYKPETKERENRFVNIRSIENGFLILSSTETKKDDEDIVSPSVRYVDGIMNIFSKKSDNKSFTTWKETYRLLTLKNITPEEALMKLIDEGKYEEALQFSNKHKLNTDAIYESQWKNSPVSENTIENCLKKVKNKWWILHECCDRIPDTLKDAYELILCGLSLVDRGDFSDYSNDEGFKEELFVSSWLDEFIFTTDEELLGTNGTITDKKGHIYFAYLKKNLMKCFKSWKIYHLMLGNGENGSMYNKEIYEKIKKSSLVELAKDQARNMNVLTVQLLLTYGFDELHYHWLDVLTNFPESFSPIKYKDLLPKCRNGKVVYLEKRELFTEEDVNFKLFKGDKISKKPKTLTNVEVSKWYKVRIREIEENTGLVGIAHDLCTIAKEFEIPDIENLELDLFVLNCAVYDLLYLDYNMTSIEAMTSSEKLKMLLSKTSEGSFSKDMSNMVFPYIERVVKCNVNNSAFQVITSYLDLVSNEPLQIPYMVFSYLRNNPEKRQTIGMSLSHLITLILHCLSNSDHNGQLKKASELIQMASTIRKEMIDDEEKELDKGIYDVSNVINSLTILKKYNAIFSLKTFIKLKQLKTFALDVLRTATHQFLARKEEISLDCFNLFLIDMTTVKNQSFKCMTAFEFLKIVVEGLLNSENISHINLANSVMQLRYEKGSVKEVNANVISYNEGIPLIINAALNYVKQSTNKDDPLIQCAKKCLDMVEDQNDDIERLMDLINSLEEIHYFKIPILPIEVIQCENQLDLIQKCIEESKEGYKETKKLMELGWKLNIKHGYDLPIVRMIARHSLKIGDFDRCYEMCMKSMRLYDDNEIWLTCKELALCEEYDNLDNKLHLIKWTMLNCPKDNIQEIMETRNKISFDSLKKDTKMEMDNYYGDEELANWVDWSNISDNKEFVSILCNKIDKWFNEFGIDLGSNTEEENKEIYGSFYKSLHTKCECVTNVKNKRNPLLKVLDKSMELYGIFLQMDNVQEEDFLGVNYDNVLKYTSMLLFPEDTLLTINTCLSITNDESLEQLFFRSFPNNLKTQKLALFCYTLKYACKYKLNINLKSSSPSQIIKEISQHALEMENDYYGKMITKFKIQIDNHEHVLKLANLNCGIDVDRFFNDPTYKIDSILGLAMFPDDDTFNLALNLASESNINKDEIILIHLSSLLTDGHGTILQKRLDNPDVLASLKHNAPNVTEKLKNSIYDRLDGKSHDILISYFTILNLVCCDELYLHLKPKEHVKVVKKVKATSNLIDYKEMINDPPKSLIRSLIPVLTQSNVKELSKLVKSLPKELKNSTSTVDLYEELMRKIFFDEGDVKNNLDWLRRFETCSEYFSFLPAAVLLNFVDEAVFSGFSIRRIQKDTRKQFLKISIELEEQKQSNEYTISILEEMYDRLK